MYKEGTDMNKKYNVIGLIALAAMLPVALYAAYRYRTTLLPFVCAETVVCLCAFAVCSVWLCLTRRTLFPFLAVCAAGIAVSMFYVHYACLFLPPLLILCEAKTALSDKAEDKVCFYVSFAGEAVCAVLAIVDSAKQAFDPYPLQADDWRVRIPAFILLYVCAAGCLFLCARSFTAVKPQKKNAHGKQNGAKNAGSGDKLPTVYLLAALSAVCSAVCGTARLNAYIVPAAAMAWLSLFVSLALCGDPVMTYLKRRICR